MLETPRPHARACARTRVPKPLPRPLLVLIACEESQAECTAFRALGHTAYSCDIQPCKPSGNPSWHIQQNVTPLLNGHAWFRTMDGRRHFVDHWDLIIAHPPCTFLSRVGSVWLASKDQPKGERAKHAGWSWSFSENCYINEPRWRLMLQARDFFFKCLGATGARYVAVENPIPMQRAQLPAPSCYIHPSWFGVKYTKKTLYWLRNLPPIMPTVEHPNPKCFTNSAKGKYRSRTFPEVAEAIAMQWSEFILNQMRST